MENRQLQSNRRTWWILALVGLILGLLPTTASALEPAAEMSIGASAVDFELKAPYERLVFVVGGPGDFYHREELTDGTSPVFDLTEAAGDGTYSYELRILPLLDPETREALAAASKKGNDEVVQQLREAGNLPQPQVQSGAFSIREGTFVRGLGREIIEKDVNDDLNIKGWVCIGDDECYQNNTFGNILHLWDEELRIHFDDSSSTSSYPTNDWKILINDLTDGGASYFAIEDSSGSKTPFKIEAGARTNALYVEDDDDVGLGTSSPLRDLHMVSGYEMAIRFEQDTSGGDTAQTWDLIANDDEFSLTDVTNSSAVPLLIEAGTPTNTIYVDSTGYIGHGTSSPDEMIHLQGDANPAIQIENTDAWPDGDEWVMRVVDVGSFRISEVGTGVVEFEIEADGTVNMANQVFTLETDGDLTIDGSLTTAGDTYPDYVFEDDYPLMSLSDLAGYIAEHRHLPDVPTAEDVDGGARINMTELQVSLLQKVEELTLYTLSQHRTMEDQQRVMESQQEVIRELQARLLALEERVRFTE